MSDIPQPTFNSSILFPNRRIKKVYKRHISPSQILPLVDIAENMLIAYLESGGTDHRFIRVYGKLGNYEQERSIAIREIIASGDESLSAAWMMVWDEIDDSILEPMQNIGKVIKSVDFYRQDMERIYGKPIADEEEQRDMAAEIEALSGLVRRQCAEVRNNIKWIDSQLL